MPFHVKPGVIVKAPFMRHQTHFRYAETSELQLLELPYGTGSFSMIILLPAPGQLSQVEKYLTFKTLNILLVQLTTCKVLLSLPRFKLSGGFLLNEILMKMGAVDAFDEELADFSGMDGRINWLYMKAVLHKTFVDVNEQGTEAAAATAVAMQARGNPPYESPVIFRADRPFLFMICENTTGSILFLGRVTNPTLEA
jgi:serpin B